MKLKNVCFRKILIGFALILTIFVFCQSKISAQTIVDKTVATVGDGLGKPQLITYSDLLWELALQRNVSLRPPSSEDLNRTLQLLINQRLFALEAERVPRAAPTAKEIDDVIKRVLNDFPSTADFENRLRIVGFDSIKDDNFQLMMARRVAIEKYLDFRFRSFAIITSEDETKYYREIYVPAFRKKNPGLLTPTLDEVRSRINETLKEQKVASDIEKFLDDAKSRAEIIVLSEV
jgi:hypothetical protein